MSLLEKLELLRQRRITAETSINSNRSQLSTLSTTLNTLANRRNSLGADLTRLQQEKDAIEALRR